MPPCNKSILSTVLIMNEIHYKLKHIYYTGYYIQNKNTTTIYSDILIYYKCINYAFKCLCFDCSIVMVVRKFICNLNYISIRPSCPFSCMKSIDKNIKRFACVIRLKKKPWYNNTRLQAASGSDIVINLHLRGFLCRFKVQI